MDFDKILHGVGPHKANLNVYFWHDNVRVNERQRQSDVTKNSVTMLGC